MFTYNLHTKAVESGEWLNGTTLMDTVPDSVLARFATKNVAASDTTQQSADAVVALFAYTEPDTFSFVSQGSKPMGVSRGGTRVVELGQNNGDTMAVTDAILLDPLIQSVAVQSSKRAHQDGLNVTLLDPNNTLLSLINPGDWIVCWMFDNTVDAAALRQKLQAKDYDGLNDFQSGLKFIGKTLAPRIQHKMLATGAFVKTCTLQASAFSELDAQMYYDPQINTNLDQGLEFMMDIAQTINIEFSGIARSVNGILAVLLPSMLGSPPRQNKKNPNQPMLIPAPIGKILGFDGAKSFMDILIAYLGVQKYGDCYIPRLANGIEKEVLGGSGTPTTQASTKLDLPLAGGVRITSQFGPRTLNNTMQNHPGIDYGAPTGTPILAAGGGVIVKAGPFGTYGNFVEIDHLNGLMTRYAHCDQILSKQGDIVTKGQQIASVGNTGLSYGPHLHFEVLDKANKVDPTPYVTPPPPVTPTAAAPTTIQIYPHPNVYSTGKPLAGAVNPQIAPFNNVPVWSVLEQHLIPVANEMYSTLRMNHKGGISPHLIFRQIPFASDEFVSRAPSDHTSFRELPRWKVDPAMVLAYDTGKSNSMRVNYVQVQVSDGVPAGDLQGLLRATTTPRWDSVDISRNGLKAYIAQVSATHKIASPELGQRWTDMVTDRMIGAHLKLSGNISIVGVQEPIATGDNLEYDGFVYHIEGIEHKVQINPMTGQKSFSTSMAISNGLPASGSALPEIAIRAFEESDESRSKLISFTNGRGRESGKVFTTIQEAEYKTRFKRGLFDPEPVVHTVVPSANVEED